MSDHLDNPVTPAKRPTKQPWVPPKLTYEGSTGELIQGGVGKSGSGQDPGDALKPPGGG